MKKVVELKAGKKFKIPNGYVIGKLIVKRRDGTLEVFKKEDHNIKRDNELIEFLEKRLIQNKLKGG
jgi:hypothetical protein